MRAAWRADAHSAARGSADGSERRSWRAICDSTKTWERNLMRARRSIHHGGWSSCLQMMLSRRVVGSRESRV